MTTRQSTQHLSAAPTNPRPDDEPRRFDVADLYRGPVATAVAAAMETSLDERLRQACFWVVNNAIISPHYDIEYNEGPPPSFQFGCPATTVRLPTGQSYSSFVLLPLLNFAVRRRCLLVGGPGHGKTVSAVLMGLIGGYTLKEVRRAIHHGQPQMTIADLIGNPLPADLVAARSMELEGRNPVLFVTPNGTGVHSMQISRALRELPLIQFSLQQNAAGELTFAYRGSIDADAVRRKLVAIFSRDVPLTLSRLAASSTPMAGRATRDWTLTASSIA